MSPHPEGKGNKLQLMCGHPHPPPEIQNKGVISIFCQTEQCIASLCNFSVFCFLFCFCLSFTQTQPLFVISPPPPPPTHTLQKLVGVKM